jgi:hypothetical protein
MPIGTTFTDFYDAMQARDIARGGGAPLGIILTEINILKANIDLLAAQGGLSLTIGSAFSAISATLGTAGTGYEPNDILTLAGGTFTGQAAQIFINTTDSGVILTFTITEDGAYSVVPTNPVTTTGGSGVGATFNVTWSQLSTPMTATSSYFNAWYYPLQYSDDGSVLCRSRMDAVIRYFSALGFRVKRERVGITNFFQWMISW